MSDQKMMDRRTFLTATVAATIAPVLPGHFTATETYSTCPAGFALRSWAQDGRTYKMVVPLPRYVDGSTCRWTEYAKRQAHNRRAG